MSRSRPWTEEEEKRLRLLYPSGRAFEEVARAFPRRSVNAVRQKASRLGLSRPTIARSILDTQGFLRCSNGDGGEEEYLFKCVECGNWIHVNLPDDAEDRTIVCSKCKAVCRFVA
jgi:DNA-directed RNA polymerase subunit RPC12/RpoP